MKGNRPFGTAAKQNQTFFCDINYNFGAQLYVFDFHAVLESNVLENTVICTVLFKSLQKIQASILYLVTAHLKLMSIRQKSMVKIKQLINVM